MHFQGREGVAGGGLMGDQAAVGEGGVLEVPVGEMEVMVGG